MKANLYLLIISIIFLFNLNAGAQDLLSYIVIRDAPDGEGKEVEKWLRSDDGSIRLYCAGYDISGNFVGNISVSWTVSLDSGNLIISPAENSDSLLVLQEGPDLRIDNVRAYHSDLNLQDTTGVLYLVDISLHYIQIRTAPYGEGREFGDFQMTADDAVNLYAAGYDSADNFIQNQIVDWTQLGTLDGPIATDTAFTFNPSIAPSSGYIQATAGNMSDATGRITVGPGVLCDVEIFNFPEYYDTLRVSVGDSIMFHVIEYDCEGNLIGDLHLDSTDIELTGTLDIEYSVNFFFHSIFLRFHSTGEGKIILMGIDTSGVIIVEEPTSIAENHIPLKYELEQAYPNPFNPITRIEFTLPGPEFVTLTVYNILGKEVATLVNNNLRAGNHVYEFDGSGLASGIYVYRIEAAKFKDMRKMILIK